MALDKRAINEARAALIARVFETEESRMRFFDSVRRQFTPGWPLSTQSVGQRLSMVEDLPQAAYARYEKDVNSAICKARQGDDPMDVEKDGCGTSSSQDLHKAFSDVESRDLQPVVAFDSATERKICDNRFRRYAEEISAKLGIGSELGVPDFVVARYLDSCLSALKETVGARDEWSGSQEGSDAVGPKAD